MQSLVRQRSGIVTVVCVWMILWSASCQSPGAGGPKPAASAAPAPAPPASAPAPPAPSPATGIFKNDKAHIELHYPGNWLPRRSVDYILLLAAPGSGEPPARTMSVDLPELPFHVPGMIPMHLVVNGYLDDLKKQHPGLRVEDSSEQTVAGCKAHHVRSSWPAGAGSNHEVAVLMVHDDHVHILRADFDDPGAAETVAAFDAVLGSLRFK